MYTHSSPSAEGWNLSDAARVDFVPLDEPAPVRRALAALRPRLLIYSCGDVWPELTIQATRAGIPTVVIGARVGPKSLRHTRLGRMLYAPTYRHLAWVGATSQQDAARWIRAGAPAGRVVVTGDPRHDHVIERVPDLHAVAPILAWAAGRRVLVAGSTDGADEKVLVSAARRVVTNEADDGLLIVPHSPTENRVTEVLSACRAAGLPSTSWASGAPVPTTPVVVIRQAGILFELYAAGTMSYVGGGFGERVHAAVESAAWALPVVVGPKAHTDRDVGLLVYAGGAALLPRATPDAALADLWTTWSDANVGTDVGLRARAALQAGASGRSIEHLTRLIGA
jgi:3-deoxy-D-manno-octulosonic-acid transferase